MKSISILLAVVAAGTLAAQTAPDPSPARNYSPAAAINSVLPNWLRFGGEYRARFEGYSGGSFKPDTSDSYWLSRLRLDLTIQPFSWLKFFVEGQDARAISKQSPAPPYQNVWDIRQAFVQLGDTDKGLAGVIVGRQELNFGDQRLIGSSPWTNNARTFDAVRGTFNYAAPLANLRLDIFAASVVNTVDGTWDHHQQGNNLHGIEGDITKLIPGATLQPYVYWRLQPGVKNESGVVSRLDEKVPGVRFVGKLPGAFDYQVEMVKEFGSLGSDRVRSWAGHWAAGRTASGLLKPRVWAEYNYASGDANPKDGIRGTFDQLYPSGHDKYGFADQVGWKNIKDFRAGVETKPRRNWTATAELNDWYLASPFDALYTTASTAIARSATGTAGTHVGEEVDVYVTWKIFPSLQTGAGIGHIFPGGFLRNTTPGNPYTYPWVSFTYGF